MFELFPNVKIAEQFFLLRFPYLASIFRRQSEEFGVAWLECFDRELEMFFGGDTKRLEKAIEGYAAFALDAMKLQVKFQKTGKYESKTYAEAASQVYQNETYMFNLYLPGILLSHYLWRHHYKQHIFFESELVPRFRQNGDLLFYDVGVGTGFYSREILRVLPNAIGVGFDMSPHSLNHATKLIGAWGLGGRYTTRICDILASPPVRQADFLINIEVLEHLEDPLSFLRALCGMLKSGGLGMVSAAINAPNADHIYLYRNAGEVRSQIEAAGFRVLEQIADEAYTPRSPDEIVPVNAAFIVTK